MAYRKRKTEFAGPGCLVQAFGLLLLFFFPIGTVIGLILLVVGGAMSVKLICSNCGNRVEKTSTLCPTCKEPLS